MRKGHRWGAIAVALPFLLVLITGLLLQVKKEFAWIQPPTARGSGTIPTLTFAEILTACQSVPELNVKSWDDVERIDVRVDRGLVKVKSKNQWEVQVDLADGKVLQTAFRRSDVIEMLHDGSWFHESAKVWIFLPSAIVVLILWISGIYLFFLPIAAKRSKKKTLANKAI